MVAIHGAGWGRKLVIRLASGHASEFAYGLTTEYASELAEGQRSLSSRSTRYRDVYRPPLSPLPAISFYALYIERRR